MKNQSKYSNIMTKKYLEDGSQLKEQLTTSSQQTSNQQQIANLSPSGKRSSSSLSGSMKKETYAKEDGSEDSSDSELSDNGILGIGDSNQIEQIDQNNELLNVQLMSTNDNELVRGEARLITKTSNQFNQWIEEPIESFLVCVCNVSVDQPYTILKCSVKCSSLDVINQCLQKARRQNESCENFVLVEELINESSSNTMTFNASLLDPLMSLGGTSNVSNQQPASTANVLNCAGLSSSTYTVNTANVNTTNLPAALLNVNQTSGQSQQGLFSFNSNCSLNRKDPAHYAAGSTNASNNTLNNTAYVRRILPDDENVYEVQRYWFGRGRLRLMLKIEAIRVPNILIPDNFDLKIAPNAPTNLVSSLIDNVENLKDLEANKELTKDEKLQVSTKTFKTFKTIKNSMSVKKKDYESLPSTPSKYSTQKIRQQQTPTNKSDDSPSTSKQHSTQNQRSQSVHHTSPQSFFSKSSQISGQLNRFTKHARNSLKKLNRFGTSKRDKDSRDNTDDSGRSSTYG